MLDITPWFIALLLGTGLIAGVINTLAGGGSNLTLPALMIMGLPADIANATNRVGVFLQCLVGVKSFANHGALDHSDVPAMSVPILLGSGLGALAASYFPPSYLKPVLLITMLVMAGIILLRPSVVIPEEDEQAKKLKGNKKAWVTLFISGVYGGFVQAGVGFILIAALAGSLRYDLLRTNALKMLFTMILTSLALLVFIVRGQVEWVPGLVLAVGTMAGARLGVKFALKVSAKTMKWFLFTMTLFASAAAMWL
ncbi:sulfite exporter TauE/SafE family protein [Aurantivibrio plasticivorans]